MFDFFSNFKVVFFDSGYIGLFVYLMGDLYLWPF